MSLGPPSFVNLTQNGPTVSIVWGAVVGAVYYVVERYEETATFADRIEIGTSEVTSFTDESVPVVIYDAATETYPAAQWRYTVSAADLSGVYTGTTRGITMVQPTVVEVQGFGISLPILADGTEYDYDQISYGNTDTDAQSDYDAIWIAYLRTIQT